MEKVLFLCTGNSCRSQMAEGLLRSMAGERYEVFSAGVSPSRVHPLSIVVMSEAGIDISGQTSDGVELYLDKDIDIVITVCDNAKQTCPVFPGEVKTYHWSVEDPFDGWGPDPDQIPNYRKTRDDLKGRIEKWLAERV